MNPTDSDSHDALAMARAMTDLNQNLDFHMLHAFNMIQKCILIQTCKSPAVMSHLQDVMPCILLSRRSGSLELHGPF